RDVGAARHFPALEGRSGISSGEDVSSNGSRIDREQDGPELVKRGRGPGGFLKVLFDGCGADCSSRELTQRGPLDVLLEPASFAGVTGLRTLVRQPPIAQAIDTQTRIIGKGL